MKLWFSLILWVGMVVHLSAAEFYVDSLQNNSVKFFAKATLGNFVGETDQVRGYIKWEGNDTVSTSKIYIEVDLASLDTGNGRRNKHMREKYLQTEKYPEAVYQGRFIEWIVESDSVFRVKTEGILSIHGVNKQLIQDATIFQRGRSLQIFLKFNLDITDFDIKKPRFLISSMNKIVALQLNLFMKPSEM